ncbi:hypothetical protein V2K66_04015 [Pseudomonas alliivorans]|nr:hypothetical protein [Pseudomonas alliivorans]
MPVNIVSQRLVRDPSILVKNDQNPDIYQINACSVMAQICQCRTLACSTTVF